MGRHSRHPLPPWHPPHGYEIVRGKHHEAVEVVPEPGVGLITLKGEIRFPTFDLHSGESEGVSDGERRARTVGKRLLSAACAFVSVLALAGGAAAITGGTLTGPTQYTYVGALYGTAPGLGTQLFCSGTRIGQTSFLTAAHCVDAILSARGAQLLVTFDSDSTKGAFVPAKLAAESATLDLAVLTIPQGGPFVQTAPAGYLDQVGKQLKDATFTNVGYGVFDPVNHPKGPVEKLDGQRRYSTSGFNALTKQLLRLSQNPSHSLGGTCTGDSGGPQLYGGYQVSVTEGGDTMCKATNVDQRLDTPEAQSFLAPFRGR
jgi:hypothetical protein